MLLLPFFTKLVLIISQQASAAQTVANAHMLFNGLGVVVMLPFLAVFEKLLNRMVPDKKTPSQPQTEMVPS